MKRIAACVVLACLVAAGLALLIGGGSQYGGRTHSPAFLKGAHHTLPVPGGFTGTLSFRGYDAVTVGNLPSGAPVAGCYTSGSFMNCGAVRAREPHARLVTIATWAGASGRILDTEPGDAVPSQDAGWIKRMIQLGVYRPGIYANASEMVQVRADLNASGLRRSQYVLWVASWDRNPAIPSGFDAKQWNSTQTLDYDTFAASFFKPKPVLLPVCVHHRMTRKSCAAGKKLLASRKRALQSTGVALGQIDAGLQAHYCRRPYRRTVCRELGRSSVTLEQRFRWFREHSASLARTL